MTSFDTTNQLYSSPRTRSYAGSGALVADIVVHTEFGGNITQCRSIRVGVGGDIALVYGKDNAGVDVTDTIKSMLPGDIINVQATTIKAAGTTCQQITVFA